MFLVLYVQNELIVCSNTLEQIELIFGRALQSSSSNLPDILSQMFQLALKVATLFCLEGSALSTL
jgi:hypothetical protein